MIAGINGHSSGRPQVERARESAARGTPLFYSRRIGVAAYCRRFRITLMITITIYFLSFKMRTRINRHYLRSKCGAFAQLSFDNLLPETNPKVQ